MAEEKAEKFSPLAQAMFHAGFALLTLLLLAGTQALIDKRAAAPFERAGGPTRTETAIEVSRFWPTGDPANFVQVESNAESREVWDAAYCAIGPREDGEPVPLLYVPQSSIRQSPVRDRAMDLGGINQHAKCAQPPQMRACVNTEQGDWNVLDLTGSPAQAGSEWLPRCPTLHETVLVASEKAPDDAPDVALAVVLAAHLASDQENPQDVTVLVIPRYLESNPGLVQQLRELEDRATGGVIVGKTQRIGDETREHLRAILVGQTTPSWLGPVKEIVIPLETILFALFMFAAGRKLGTAAETPVIRATKRLRSGPPPKPETPPISGPRPEPMPWWRESPPPERRVHVIVLRPNLRGRVRPGPKRRIPRNPPT